MAEAQGCWGEGQGGCERDVGGTRGCGGRPRGSALWPGSAQRGGAWTAGSAGRTEDGQQPTPGAGVAGAVSATCHLPALVGQPTRVHCRCSSPGAGRIPF